MRMSPFARIHLMITFALVMSGVAGGACLGWVWGGRAAGLLAAVAAGLGAAIGSFFSRRHVAAFLAPPPASPERAPGFVPVTLPAPGRVGGYAEGVADAVVASLAMYQAAAFPLTAFGVSEEERAARRRVAYRVCAHEGLPQAVRVSAAAALEAVDHGEDAERAHAAMRALSLAVYDHRASAAPQPAEQPHWPPRARRDRRDAP